MELGCSNGSSKLMHTPYSGTKEIEFDKQPKDSSKGTSFIKLLGPDFSKQLKIPREFTVIFNGSIPYRFIIENATTKECWRVGVEEEGDGTVYFREGWSDFVEAHSLHVGNFLLFEYEEQSIFQVEIYDKNGCQKTFVDAQGGKHNPVKIIDFDEQEESADLKFEPKKLETSHPNQQKTRLPPRKYGNRTYKKKHAISRKYTRTATVSLTGKNMAFSVKVHKYKTHQFFNLTLPKAISIEKNLASKDEVILENDMGNRWLVKLTHRKDGRSILSHGWKAFFQDNEVAAEDTLKFEFVSDGLVQVRVMKASQFEQNLEEAKSQNGEAIAQDMDCEVDELDACTANVNPTETSISTKRGRKKDSSELSGSSFSFLWRPTTTGFYLHIPKVVTESQNLMNEDKVVLRDQDGKCWPVEVSTRRDGRVALTKGWVEFWKGHDIKAGDTLHFDFVSDYLIQVHITRGKPLDSPIKEDIVNLSITDDDEPAPQPETIMTQAEAAAALPAAIDFS